MLHKAEGYRMVWEQYTVYIHIYLCLCVCVSSDEGHIVYIGDRNALAVGFVSYFPCFYVALG